MTRFAVQLLAEGFLHPASDLEHERVDAQGLLHLPVRELDDVVQFFRCRVQGAAAALPIEYVLSDAGAPASDAVVQSFLSSKFLGSSILLLRSQDTGHAVIDCAVDSPLPQGAAAAVAVVMHSAAGDDSEAIAVEGGGVSHVLAVGVDESGHWAEPVPS